MSDTASVHDTTREYIQVTPSTEEFEFVNIKQLSSLHKLTTGDDNDGGALSSLNPFSGGEHPVTVEFLALTTGDDGAVELYYGADAELNVLQRRLESIYPHTFDIERVGMNPRKRLVEPVEFSIEEFVNLLRDGRLQVDYDDLAVDAASALAEPDRPALESPDSDRSEEELADGGTTPNGATPMENLFGEEAAETVQQEATIQSVYAQEPLDEESEDAEQPITRDEGRNRPLRALDDPSVIDLGDEYVIVAPPEDCPSPSQRADLDGPTATGEGTILARPALSETEPEGLRWHGQASRKKDWMTAMETAADAPTADQPRRNDERPNRSAVLTSIAETLHRAEVPTAFQVLFTRKPDWSVSASKRKSDLENNRDTFSQKLVRNFTGPIDRDDNSDLPTSISRRQDLIDAKTPKRTFTVNCRAVSVSGRQPVSKGTDGTDTVADGAKETTRAIDGLEPALDPMAGAYYQLEPQRTADSGGLLGGSLTAENVLENLLERTLTTRDREKSTLGKVASSAKSKPDIVLNARELADLAVVPSAEEFRVDAFRATGATHEIDNPLPQPNQQTLEQFDHGMAIGYPLDDLGEPTDDPVRIPPSVLQRHYARFAATGSGKSIGGINDLLSIHAATDGLTILSEPKGDGMCQDYLRCHFQRFGTLEDVYLFELPDVVPAMSFFDIRPALAAGRQREDAIQDKVDHFHWVMEMLMGEQQYGNAYVAKGVISFLIKALFDPEHGTDAFTIDDLLDAALTMQTEQQVPVTAADRDHVEDMLNSHFAKADHDFQKTMDAVLNRLSKIKENTTVAQLFENVPEWDDDRGTYARGATAFSFADLLDEDAVVLFDLGPLRQRAQRSVTLLLLSDLWTSLRGASQSGDDASVSQTNLILEEAAPIAASQLVTEQLLPQSRSFGLSLGFVMQFPSQVEMENSRAYQEILNNVQSTLYSRITKQDDIGEILAAGEYTAEEMAEKLRTIPRGHWIADLPSPAFEERPPRPFSVKALPIPQGHPDGDEPLEGRSRERFDAFYLDDCRKESQRYAHVSGQQRDGVQETQPQATESPTEDRKPGDTDTTPTLSESHQTKSIDSLLDEQREDEDGDGEQHSSEPSKAEDISPDSYDEDSETASSSDPFGNSSGTADPSNTESSRDTTADETADSEPADGESPAGDTDSPWESTEDSDSPQEFASREEVLDAARAINADYDLENPSVEGAKERGDRCIALRDRARDQGIDVKYGDLLNATPDDDSTGDSSREQASADSESVEAAETDSTDEEYGSVEEVLAEARAINARHADPDRDDKREKFAALGELCDEAQAQGLDISYEDVVLATPEESAGSEEQTESEDSAEPESAADSERADECKGMDEEADGDSNAESKPAETTTATDDTEQNAQSPRAPFQGAYSENTDEDLADLNLSRDDEQFLDFVLSAMNRDLEDYSLTTKMTDFPKWAGDPDVEMLEDRGLVERHRVMHRRYYSVLPAGRDFLNKPLKTGEGVGDLGEKTPHKVGVEYLRRRFEQLEEVSETVIYYELHDDVVLDVVAFDAEGTLCHAGEVETTSNNPSSVVDDYEKLAHTNPDVTTWWATPVGNTATEVLETLIDAGRCPELSGSDLHSITEMRAAVDDLELAGMDELRTYNQLKEKVES